MGTGGGEGEVDLGKSFRLSFEKVLHYSFLSTHMRMARHCLSVLTCLLLTGIQFTRVCHRASAMEQDLIVWRIFSCACANISG